MRLRRLLTRAAPLAGLALLVVAVHAVVVLAIGDVPTADQAALLAASMVAAGATALLYVPVRARLRATAARRLLGAGGLAGDVLRSFGSRLADPLPLEELLLQLAESLRRTLALESAEVWTGAGGILERAASDPDLGTCSMVLSAEEETVVARAGVCGATWAATWTPALVDGHGDAPVRVLPATHAGELLGLLVVRRPHGAEPFTEADDDALLALARQIGLALHNVRLGSALRASLDELQRQADELRASRARVVAAADAERRRIERDLHDGAQQQLYALAINVRLARELAESDPPGASAVLAELSTDLEQALEQFRDLARGIYPTVLVDRGLAEGLRAAAARARMPTRLDVRVGRRYPAELEATVYFCCLEALQNAARHAGEGARATVRIWEDGGRLHFEVVDDGVGFEPADGLAGAGLANLGDRVGALGGRPALRSAPGAGTTVGGWVPLQPSSS
ncbi:MAG TPA: histidine kinase [Baekduia sp.]